MTVYTVLSDKGEMYFSDKKTAENFGSIYSVRTFKNKKSYAVFYFKNNNNQSQLKVPEYDIMKDLTF